MMLSAIGRVAAQRLGARVSHSMPKLQRVIMLGNASNAATRDRILQLPVRGYATAATTTKAKPASSKAKVVKKPAAKKTKKAAAKAKPAKKAAKKPVKKVVKKPVKVLTEEQKAKKAEKDRKATIKELKVVALLGQEPKAIATTAYGVLQKELFADTSAFAGKQSDITSTFTGRVKDLSNKYSNLSASELEHYNQIANQNKAQFESSYKSWVQGHSAEEIRLANMARSRLGRLNNKLRGYPKINDERIVAQPRTAYTHYTISRWESGDFKGVSVMDAARLIGAEFKKLSASELQPFKAAYDAEKKRYEKEFLSVYGHPSPSSQVATAA